MPINNPLTITITINGGGNDGETQTIILGDEEMQNWQTRNSAYTMQNRDRVIADVENSPLTLKLPALARYGDEVEIAVDGGNTLTIDGNQAYIEGVLTPYTVTGDKTKLHLIYKDEVKGWLVTQSTSVSSTPNPNPTPTPTGIQLTYQTSGDENGLFYWLGSEGKTQSWSNPATTGEVAITTQATVTAYHDVPQNLTDRQSNLTDGVWLRGVNSKIIFDLGTKKLVPNYYSIKSWGNGDRFPRNWRLEGANEINGPWSLIKSHENDASLNSPSTWASWPITGIVEEFKYLAIVCTGVNKEGSDIEITLAEVEFYGVLKSAG